MTTIEPKTAIELTQNEHRAVTRIWHQLGPEEADGRARGQDARDWRQEVLGEFHTVDTASVLDLLPALTSSIEGGE